MTDATLLSEIDDDVVGWMTPGHPGRQRLLDDPYTLFDRIRDTDPVFKSSLGPWLVTKYDDVLGVLREPRWSRDPQHAMNRYLAGDVDGDAPGDRLDSIFETWMLYRDPPSHERLRRMVSRVFTPRQIERWRYRIEEIATELLTELRHRESFDLLSEFAAKVPLTVICEMIGLPLRYAEEFASWSNTIVELQEPGNRTPEFEAHARAALDDCFTCFRELAEEKRRSPADDIVSMLVTANDSDASPASEREIIGTCILLNVAGQETTTHRISNGLFYLLSNPEADRALRQDVSLAANTTEEILRYSAVNALPRYAVTDMAVGDKVVPAGDIVLPCLGAANRDPARFDEPHRFDITRANSKEHITFGNGLHYCLGVHLARMESNAVFTVLYRDFPPLEVASDDFRWRDTFVVRGLTALPVAWSTGNGD